MLRSLFIPHNACKWRRADYSQIEYRLLAHYAVGERADQLRAQYNTQPDINFHKMTSAMILEYTGVELGYKSSKNFNFGMCYGMGKDKIMHTLGVEPGKAEALYDAYFEALPCVKETFNSAQRLVERRGYIKTLLGRRSRFNKYEENPFRAGQMQRAGARKALNRCLQGGAADILKKAMLMCWREGLFYGDNCPHITVHDELGWSDIGDVPHYAKVQDIMEHCVKLKVPLLVSMETGETWGDCK